MSEYNIISKSIWGSEKFASLKKDQFAKLLYLYFLNSPHSNSCGCYAIRFGYIAADLDCSEENVRYGIDTLSKAYLIEYDYDENTVFIPNFLTYNPPRNPKHAIKVFNDALMIPSKKMKAACIAQLSAIISDKTWKMPKEKQDHIDMISKGYPIPLPDLATPRLNSYPDSTHKDFSATSSVATGTQTETDVGLRGKKKKPALPENLNGEIPESFLMSDGTFKNFDGLYELLWAKYPSIRHKGNKDKAKIVLREILKKGTHYGKIIDAVDEYRAFCVREQQLNKDFFRWLKDGDYQNDYKPGAVTHTGNGRHVKNRTYDPSEAFSLALSDPKGRLGATDE